VLAVRYATRNTRKSELFLDYEQYGDPDEPAVMDYFFWIVRDGARTVLVDTGFDPAVGERRGRTCLCAPLEALARLGIERDSVEQIVLTHLHYDHTGNVGAFPNAELVVQSKELDFWTGPLAAQPEHASLVERGELDAIVQADREGRVRRLDGDEAIAPGISAVLVGGHSPGQQVIIVQTAGGPVVLASDALHYYEELERERPFAIVVDLDEMVAAYETLRGLAGQAGAQLVAGHDPAVLDRFHAIEGGLAVRLA
jgi:glyoxylase-like metal-dependent hydrolase (beta-lactamase superfamily II)